jgi:DNA-directed RNA polymerase specialized sigma24 family protein
MGAFAKSGESIKDTLALWQRWVITLSSCIAQQLDLESEDVQQDLLCHHVRVFHKFDSSRSSFSTFASLIARNLYTSKLAEKRHSPRVSSRSLPDDGDGNESILDLFADPTTPNPVADAGRRELIDLVRREVARLPPRLRECVLNYFGFDGRERSGRTDTLALSRGLIRLKARIRIAPVQLG